jgi:hypothetical protein
MFQVAVSLDFRTHVFSPIKSPLVTDCHIKKCFEFGFDFAEESSDMSQLCVMRTSANFHFVYENLHEYETALAYEAGT